jgi:hypothetical protein
LKLELYAWIYTTCLSVQCKEEMIIKGWRKCGRNRTFEFDFQVKSMEENKIGILFSQASNFIEPDGDDIEDEEIKSTEDIEVMQDCLDSKPQLPNPSAAPIR